VSEECQFCNNGNPAVKRIEGFFDDGESTALAFVDVCAVHFQEYEQWESSEKDGANFYWHCMASMRDIKELA